MNDTNQDSDQPEKPGPTEMHDPIMQREVKKAAIWIGLAVLAALIAYLSQPLLLIFGGMVFAFMLDGGTRLLGRVLPIPRGFRLLIVLLLTFGFIIWTLYFAGSQLTVQAAALPVILEAQVNWISGWADSIGLTTQANDFKGMASQILGGFGRVTAAVTTALGALTSFAMILVLGIFMAAEPRLYEHGLAWMVPMSSRSYFYGTMDKIGFTMRRLLAGRLLGMAVEGLGTWILLSIAGVPMAALLGLLTGLLAFLPNIGAIISGVLIVAVGFSGGVDTGIYAVIIYMTVQLVDGYLIVPMVARKTVDLAPALVLAAQLIFGALFGVLGLALADPMVALLKVSLERQSSRNTKPNGNRLGAKVIVPD